MPLAKQLANRFKEVMLDGTWIANTNYKSQLDDLNWKQATTQVNSYNTIALLTFHINYYVKGFLQVFQDGTLTISDKYSFNAPKITSQEDWVHLKNELLSNSEALAKEFEQLTDKQLSAPFVKEAYGTYHRNIDGMIEHCYYHLGQISLIKKTVLETEK